MNFIMRSQKLGDRPSAEKLELQGITVLQICTEILLLIDKEKCVVDKFDGATDFWDNYQHIH